MQAKDLVEKRRSDQISVVAVSETGDRHPTRRVAPHHERDSGAKKDGEREDGTTGHR